MENTLVRIIVFAVLNFGALGIGVYLMGQGATSDWYQGLNKAPWTPPGWVFGAAWTTIMVFFSIYMSLLWKDTESIKVLITIVYDSMDFECSLEP
jgi:benzodiazapine receptor